MHSLHCALLRGSFLHCAFIGLRIHWTARSFARVVRLIAYFVDGARALFPIAVNLAVNQFRDFRECICQYSGLFVVVVGRVTFGR